MTWLTPPEVAERLHVDPAKVLGWIRAGELVAADLASHGSRRPRYRVSPEALEAFILRRCVTTAPKVRKQRKSNANVIAFY